MASSPRILNRPTDRHHQSRSYAKARLAVHHRSACSGLKALRNTSAAKEASRQALLPFRSLDPFRALREPDRRRRDEERLSSSEQRTGKNQKRPLDRKSPIQVRIRLPPAVSHVRRRVGRDLTCPHEQGLRKNNRAANMKGRRFAARICSLEYRESAQWGAAATKSRRGRRGPSAAERSPAA